MPGARYYDQVIARWQATDPLAEKHPDWAPYNYVLGNPMNLFDPDGRQEKAMLNSFDPGTKFGQLEGRFDTRAAAAEAVGALLGVAVAVAPSAFPTAVRWALYNPGKGSVAAKEGVDFVMGLVTDAPDPEVLGGGTLGQELRRLGDGVEIGGQVARAWERGHMFSRRGARNIENLTGLSRSDIRDRTMQYWNAAIEQGKVLNGDNVMVVEMNGQRVRITAHVRNGQMVNVNVLPDEGEIRDMFNVIELE